MENDHSHHNWQFVGEDTAGAVHWCSQCGAIKKENPVEISYPIKDAEVCVKQE